MIIDCTPYLMTVDVMAISTACIRLLYVLSQENAEKKS